MKKLRMYEESEKEELEEKTVFLKLEDLDGNIQLVACSASGECVAVLLAFTECMPAHAYMGAQSVLKKMGYSANFATWDDQDRMIVRE